MVDKVVGSIVTDVQAGDLLFVDRAGQLREMEVATLGIDHITLTEDVGGDKTYTLYRSSDSSVVFGTIVVRDGADGSGSTWPDYNNLTPYGLTEVVVDDDERVYRCAINGTVGIKPQVGGVVDPAWELINVGGLAVAHDPTQSYGLGDIVLLNNKLYAPSFPIVASIPLPVPFVEGRAQDEWYNVAEGPTAPFDTAGIYAMHDVVRQGGAWYQANGPMDGTTVPLVFNIGVLATDFRSVGTPLDGSLVQGFFDYNDAATATTPVTVTGGGSAYLTNDEAGAFTSKTYAPSGVTDVWIAGATNEFDWSELSLGDTLDIRLDVEIDVQSVNTEVNIVLELAGGAYSVGWLNPINYKNVGVEKVVCFNSIYMGDTGTLNGAAKFQVSADKTCDVKVNGWYVRIFK